MSDLFNLFFNASNSCSVLAVVTEPSFSVKDATLLMLDISGATPGNLPPNENS